jgi:hypothetical protein
MWRVADRLNRYEQFVTTIDGVDIHFLRARSPVEGATPCIMTHGWPGSVMEWAISPPTRLQPSSSPKCARDSALWHECRSLCDASG